MQNNVNELMHSLYTARQNANTTGISTALCGSSDGRQCSTTGEWTQGWLLFANNDDDEPPRIDAGEAVLTRSRLSPQLHLYANRDAFVMRPFGLRNTNGTLVWCDRRGATDARAVIVSFTGKPRSSSTAAGGQPLQCLDNP
jgi:type IV fimbrial biogenesis protein FimT